MASTQERIKAAQEEYQQKVKTTQMMKEVKATKTRAEQQLAREYQRYQDALKSGNAKMANDALKMFNFIYKMNALADRFVVTLERVQSIQDLFNILSGTCEVFTQIMALDNNAVMKDMRKNLKTFKKKLREYERQMDELFDFIDGIFDERPNPIVRFFNKLFGKKEKTPEEQLQENMAAFGGNLATYEQSIGAQTTTAGGASAPTSAPSAAPTAPDGGPKPITGDDGVFGGI